MADTDYSVAGKRLSILELNNIYNMDCLEGMKLLPDCNIDLTVTSPPYDNLRTYNGYTWDFQGIAKELYRVTKQGGVVVWVVNDATVKGSETGTSFRQALFFMDCGFNLHDTMIYEKGGQGACGSNLSYWQNFEYMFVLVKGKLKTFHPIADRVNVKHESVKREVIGHRKQNGEIRPPRTVNRKLYGKRFNVWKYHECNTRINHPAVFPEQLANDHIISWSNIGDTILDPFAGSGTTAKMAKLNNRNYIGFEISEEYCNIANKRIAQSKSPERG